MADAPIFAPHTAAAIVAVAALLSGCAQTIGKPLPEPPVDRTTLSFHRETYEADLEECQAEAGYNGKGDWTPSILPTLGISIGSGGGVKTGFGLGIRFDRKQPAETGSYDVMTQCMLARGYRLAVIDPEDMPSGTSGGAGATGAETPRPRPGTGSVGTETDEAAGGPDGGPRY